jgi:hypothetical protein
MGLIDKLLGSKTAITSSSIRAEIERCESEIANHRAKIASAEAEIATLDDAAHVKVIETNAALSRAIARLEARVATLDIELPAILAAEEAAAKAEADAALLKRATAARKSNSAEAKKLLEQYADHAAAIADVLTKLKAITTETTAVNELLRSNPVCEGGVVGYNTIHRSTPGTEAVEQRARVPHWVYRDAPPQPDEVYPGSAETVVRATLDPVTGKPIAPAGAHYGRFGQVIQPVLEMREVVTRSGGRRAVHAPSLSDVRLPPAFAGGVWAWPRKS